MRAMLSLGEISPPPAFPDKVLEKIITHNKMLIPFVEQSPAFSFRTSVSEWCYQSKLKRFNVLLKLASIFCHQISPTRATFVVNVNLRWFFCQLIGTKKRRFPAWIYVYSIVFQRNSTFLLCSVSAQLLMLLRKLWMIDFHNAWPILHRWTLL